MLNDYLIVYQVRDEQIGIGQGNATVHDFPLTYKALEAVLDKIMSSYNKEGGHVTQVIVLNVIQLEKESDKVITEYAVEVNK